MQQVLDAVYEKGSFRPLGPVALPEGQRVSISVQPLAMTPADADAYLQEWHDLYAGLSDDEVAALEQAILDRTWT